jgi:hypothetical protein
MPHLAAFSCARVLSLGLVDFFGFGFGFRFSLLLLRFLCFDSIQCQNYCRSTMNGLGW